MMTDSLGFPYAEGLARSLPVDSLELLINNIPKSKEKAFAISYLLNYKFDKVERTPIPWVDEVIAFSNTTKDSKLQFLLFRSLGMYYEKLGNFVQALHFFGLSEEYLDKIKIPDWQVVNATNLIWIHKTLKNYETAFEYAFKNLDARTDSSASFDLGYAHYLLGLLYKDIGDRKEALKELTFAEGLFRQTNHVGFVGRILFEKSMILQDSNFLDSALVLADRAVDIYQPLNSKKALGEIAQHKGNIYLAKEEYGLAINYLIKGDSLLQGTRLQFNSYESIGNAYLAMENYDAAEEYYIRYLNAVKQQPKSVDLTSAHSNLARLYLKKKDYEKTKFYAIRAKNSAIKQGLEYKLHKINDYLFEAHFKLKEYEQAFAIEKENTSIREREEKTIERRTANILNLRYQLKNQRDQLDKETQLMIFEKTMNTRILWLAGVGGSILFFLLAQNIRIARNRNKVLSAKNREIALLNENLEAKVLERTRALEANQHELSLIYNNTQDLMGLLYIDNQDKAIIESLNKSYLKYARQALDNTDFIGLSFEEYFRSYLKLPEDQIRQQINYIEEVRFSKTRATFEITFPGIAKFPETIFEVVLTPILEKKTGECSRIIFSMRDITENIQVRKALVEREKKLSTIYNATLDYIGLINRESNGNIILESFNDPAIKYLMEREAISSAEEVNGLDMHTLFEKVYKLSPEAIAFRMNNIEAVFEKCEKFIYQSRFNPKENDRDDYFETIISPIIDAEGNCNQALYVARDITEREKSKAKIVASERRLSMVFNGSNDPSFIFDVSKNGTLTFAEANLAFKKAVKESSEHIKTKDLHGKDAHYFLRDFMNLSKKESDQRLYMINRVIKQKKPIQYEEYFINKNGDKLDLEVTAAPILNKSNECEQLLFVSRNITKKLAAQRALKLSERRLASIYNSSQDYIGLIKLNANGQHFTESFNKPTINLLTRGGLINAEKDLTNVNVAHFFQRFGLSKQKIETRVNILTRLIENPVPVIYTNKIFIKKHSFYMDFEITISPILDNNGNCTHALFSARDITEKEIAKNKLIKNQKRLASIFNGTTDFMMIIDINSDGTLIIEDTNQSFKDAWANVNPDFKFDTIVGKDIPYFLEKVVTETPFETKYYINLIQTVIREKRPMNFEHPYVPQNGKNYLLDINIVPILDNHNHSNKVLIVFRDVTIKRRASEKMISKILETEDRERSRFAKELHDSLGQNLTAASINFNLVKKGIHQLSSNQQNKFKTGIKFLKEAIEESRNIAHNLMPQSITDFGYVLTVESLLENLRESTNISFTFYNNLNGQRLPIEIELSIYRITQEAINNILKHAKATQVTIQLINHTDSLILTIEDNGEGFNTSHQITSFGLNSMRNRVSAHSGAMEIDSYPGKGTSITVEIPTEFVN